MATIVLDPGHGGAANVGGSDANHAKGPSGLLEKTVTLDVARRVAAELAASGHAVVLTRDADVNLSLAARANVARAIRAPVFVSIHFNGFNTVAQGTETFCHKDHSPRSANLCRAVQKAVRAATGLTDRNADAPGGVKTMALGVLNPARHHSGTACVLVEISFMDVPAEDARLQTDTYRKKIAKGLAAGIVSYVTQASEESIEPEGLGEVEVQDAFEAMARGRPPALPAAKPTSKPRAALRRRPKAAASNPANDADGLEAESGLRRVAPDLHRADQFETGHGEPARREARATAKGHSTTGAGRWRTPAELAEGPQTFRDPLLSVFQSAAAAVAARRAGIESTEGPADESAILDAEAACIDALEGRGLGGEVNEETLGFGARAALCAKLGFELFKAELAGNKAAVEALSQQMIAGTCDTAWAGTLKEYAKAYGLFADPAKRRYVRPKTVGARILRMPASATIAVFGDWGTGARPARQVLAHVAKRAPDVVLHLGDIYYSGTPDECERNFEAVIDAELKRGASKLPPVYTLCGNHDMYSGGEGYYDLIGRLNAGDRVQKASFFCLRAEDESWQILGMDTGRNDYSPYSVSSTVTFIEPEEEAWLEARVREFGGKTILASHHPMFSCFGACGPKDAQGRDTPVNPHLKRLFDRLVAAGGRIPAWLWGHEHNLGIYESYAGLAAGRCIGHGGVPVFSADEPYEVPAGLANPPALKPGTRVADLGRYAAHGFALIGLAGDEVHVEYIQDRGGVAETHFRETIR